MTHLLFAGHNYYPNGGIADLFARGTIEDLKKYFQENAEAISGSGGYIDNWGQIVSADTLECVLLGELDHDGRDLGKPGVAVWYDTPPD